MDNWEPKHHYELKPTDKRWPNLLQFKCRDCTTTQWVPRQNMVDLVTGKIRITQVLSSHHFRAEVIT